VLGVARGGAGARSRQGAMAAGRASRRVWCLCPKLQRPPEYALLPTSSSKSGCSRTSSTPACISCLYSHFSISVSFLPRLRGLGKAGGRADRRLSAAPGLRRCLLLPLAAAAAGAHSLRLGQRHCPAPPGILVQSKPAPTA
jgi:hypothetical protein